MAGSSGAVVPSVCRWMGKPAQGFNPIIESAVLWEERCKRGGEQILPSGCLANGHQPVATALLAGIEYITIDATKQAIAGFGDRTLANQWNQPVGAKLDRFLDHTACAVSFGQCDGNDDDSLAFSIDVIDLIDLANHLLAIDRRDGRLGLVILAVKQRNRLACLQSQDAGGMMRLVVGQGDRHMTDEMRRVKNVVSYRHSLSEFGKLGDTIHSLEN